MPSLSNERVALLIARPADPLESTSALSAGNDLAAHNAYIRDCLRSDRTWQAAAAASTHGPPGDRARWRIAGTRRDLDHAHRLFDVQNI
jgi:hypothetical protein